MFETFRLAGAVPAILHRAALMAFLLLGSGPLQAARPLLTDDAAVVPPGACQLEAWGERPRGATILWLNPGCNPSTATEVSLGFGWLKPEESEAIPLRRLQIKHLLVEGGERSVGFALALGSEWAPTHDFRERFLNAIATIPLAGEVERVHLNLGFSSSREAARRFQASTWAAAFERALGARRVALEVHGTSGERAGWQLGFAHEVLPGRLQLDASLGSRFGRLRESRAITLGLVWLSAPDRP
ncbi:MAG: hypothetical protein KatS3mg125_0510 [Lysobacterales bacterium]|nr:MAG: hypothetical protein KatS3mg125_0510 [Xanthomonadales bacterium]